MRISEHHLYPFIVFIEEGLSEKVHAVKVNNYEESTSVSAFTRLNLNTACELSQKFSSFAPYRGTFYTINDFILENLAKSHPEKEKYVNDWDELLKLAESPVDLYDFYKTIGYERKAKKMQGVTFRKWLIINMNKEI